MEDDVATALSGGVADFVLELADCDAFVKMYDRTGKGWLDVDDLMFAIAP